METNKEYRLVPTFGDSYGTGWKVMSDSFLRLFLLVLVMAFIAAPFKIFNFHINLADLHGNPWHRFRDFENVGLIVL